MRYIQHHSNYTNTFWTVRGGTNLIHSRSIGWDRESLAKYQQSYQLPILQYISEWVKLTSNVWASVVAQYTFLGGYGLMEKWQRKKSTVCAQIMTHRRGTIRSHAVQINVSPVLTAHTQWLITAWDICPASGQQQLLPLHPRANQGPVWLREACVY